MSIAIMGLIVANFPCTRPRSLLIWQAQPNALGEVRLSPVTLPPVHYDCYSNNECTSMMCCHSRVVHLVFPCLYPHPNWMLYMASTRSQHHSSPCTSLCTYTMFRNGYLENHSITLWLKLLSNDIPPLQYPDRVCT